jgi:anti-anti-sigma factor
MWDANAFSTQRRYSGMGSQTENTISGICSAKIAGHCEKQVSGTDGLREKLKNIAAAGQRRIVLNMSNVKYIDSTGLGMLVAAHFSAQKQGASLSLCHGLCHVGSRLRGTGDY